MKLAIRISPPTIVLAIATSLSLSAYAQPQSNKDVKRKPSATDESIYQISTTYEDSVKIIKLLSNKINDDGSSHTRIWTGKQIVCSKDTTRDGEDLKTGSCTVAIRIDANGNVTALSYDHVQ